MFKGKWAFICFAVLGVSILSTIFFLENANAQAITWTQVNTDGFGDPNNTRCVSNNEINGYLYVGTRNTSVGCQVWRTNNGTTWTQVNTNGFGATNGQAAGPLLFKDFIYFGTSNPAGGLIYRSPASDGTTWTQVNTNGFGDPNNWMLWHNEVIGDYIYFSTENPTTGAELWRSTDGTTWTRFGASDFSDPEYDGLSIQQVNGYLFVTAEEWTSNTGFRLWISSDGANWTQVTNNGFGDGNNNSFTVRSYEAPYYFGATSNSNTGFQIWRSLDGINWEQTEVPNGFGDANNQSLHTSRTIGSHMYLGTLNQVTGGELWRVSSDFSERTQINTDGFGDPNNIRVRPAISNSQLYATTRNQTTGTEVWQARTFALNVSKDGTGTGTVTSSPAGIDCGSECGFNFSEGTEITLTATPDALHAFQGWSGADCPGNHTCIVTMSQALNITATFNPDDDGDGVTTIMENGGPNNGDANEDGKLDSGQEDVSTFKNINDQYVTLVSGSGTILKEVTAQINPSEDNAPAGVTFPEGFYGFKNTRISPGGTAIVELILHESNNTINTLYKYGPTPDQTADHWYDFKRSNGTGAEFGDRNGKPVVTILFVDGQRGDGDLTADGVIVDPSGPGNEGGGGGLGGGGGGGGCFLLNMN